jgi:hypothetical protein
MAVLVIAILHLVFGGLGLLCTVCGGLMDLAGAQKALAQAGDAQQQQMAQQQRRKEVTERVHMERIPLYQAYSVTNRVLSTLFCIVLVAAGIGLLLMQSWARWLSVGYAVLSILTNMGVFVYTIAFFIPADHEAFRRLPPQSDQEQLAYNIANVVAPAGPCVMMLYPAVVLIVLLLPSVGAAFQPRKRRRREDYDDEPDEYAETDDRWRDRAVQP